MLEDAADTLPNLKMEDIESTILSSDEPLPEIKNEEVEVIISDLIENADDIVNDPEQHLKLDDDDDIITNLDNELKELGEDDGEQNFEQQEEEAAPPPSQVEPQQQPAPVVEKEPQKIDPFEFAEDEPEVLQPPKSSMSLIKHHMLVNEEQHQNVAERHTLQETNLLIEEKEIKKEMPERKDSSEEKKSAVMPGSVEIVEVVVLEEDEIEKQLNKSQIEDIVHSRKPSEQTMIEEEQSKTADVVIKEEPQEDNESLTEATVVNETMEDKEIKEELDNARIDIDESENSRRNTFTPEYSEEYFDDLNMSVTKPEKSGKAKRDYSRTKKKEEKDFHILLAVEKAVNGQLEENEFAEDSFSDREFREAEKKYGSLSKLRSETDRSNSPWTEDEDLTNMRNKRRYSTPATPTDSIPNSPASSSAYCDDERDNRSWKKAVMLVYGHLAAHKYASLFLKPITDEQAPGYHTVVYRPMDLQTIRKNIESGAIRTTAEFQRDVLLMFTNAIMYNKTNDLIYNMAAEMQKEAIQHIKQFLQAQGQMDGPLRRETRTSEPGGKRKRESECFNNRAKKRKDD